MSTRTNLGVVLELLREEPTLQAGEGPVVRGASGTSGAQSARREEVVEHVRTDTDAQLTLFLLAAELRADGTETEAELREALRAFVEAVHDRFDVNLLRTAAAHPERVPAFVPDDLLDEAAIASLDD